MGGQHSVKNAGLVLDVLAEGGNVADKMVSQEGGWGRKVMHLASLWDELFALSALDVKELGKELVELDSEDLAALQEKFKVKFDLADDKVEALVEEGLALAKLHGDAVVQTIAWVKKLKEPKAAPVA